MSTIHETITRVGDGFMLDRLAALGPHRTADPHLDMRTITLVNTLGDDEYGYHIVEGPRTTGDGLGVDTCERCGKPVTVSEDEDTQGAESHAEGLRIAVMCYRCSGVITDLLARDDLSTVINDIITAREDVEMYHETLRSGGESTALPVKVATALAHLVDAQRLISEHLTDCGYQA